MKRILTCLVTCISFILIAFSAFAAGPLTVDIHGPGQRMVNMVILPPKGLDGVPVPEAAARSLEELIANNLSYIPFLKMVGVNELLGGDPSTGVKGAEIDFKPLQLARVDLCMTTGWNGEYIEARVFETFSGRRVVGKSYRDVSKNLPLVADRFSSSFLEALTGKKGFFDSPIAFVRQNGNKSKEIFTVLPQGRELTRITKIGEYNLSPTWSADGDKIAFTHIGKTRHELCVYDSKTKRIKRRYKGLGSTIISPVYSADDKLYVALNRNGATNIYGLDKLLKPDMPPLVRSPYIDVSPSFDRKGEQMVFTSSRAGNPHIYLLNLVSGKIRRVTTTGRYNTHPCLSPNGRYVAYTHQTSEGHRIYLHDLQTGREKQISFGPGNDEYPAFGPDGYFVAFASSRTGEYKIYLTTRHGDAAKMIPTGKGAAFAPAWDTSLQW